MLLLGCGEDKLVADEEEGGVGIGGNIDMGLLKRQYSCWCVVSWSWLTNRALHRPQVSIPALGEVFITEFDVLVKLVGTEVAEVGVEDAAGGGADELGDDPVS